MSLACRPSNGPAEHYLHFYRKRRLYGGPISIGKPNIAVCARFLVVVLLLGSAMSLQARGRARGYQAGGGAHRAQLKLRVKQPKEKRKKPAAQPVIKPASLNSPTP
jgi:hypothetical protein